MSMPVAITAMVLPLPFERTAMRGAVDTMGESTGNGKSTTGKILAP